jgi:hypothetical protein
MKSTIFILLVMATFVPHTSQAQTSKSDTTDFIESNVIPLAGKKGISLQTRSGDFLFKPYVLVQTKAQFQYFDDEGLDLAEQDNIQNTGFGLPYAMVGFSGKAFNKVTFNLALNMAASGSALVNQAWVDVNVKESLRFRIGKFKTPFNQAYLVQLGETLFPVLPFSLTTRVNLPFDINSVNPTIASGLDIGVQMHGLLYDKWEYRLGIFNGTGIGVNEPTNSLSDEFGIPSLMYSGRLAYMPFGPMPTHQGNPDDLDNRKFLIAASASYYPEANYESSNDFRSGIEVAYLYKRLYVSAEGYLMNMDFTERQQVSPDYKYWGAYAQGGYFATKKLQPVVRIDVMDRNSTKEKGLLYMPSAGANYFLFGYNLKLQLMYQMLMKSAHVDQFSSDDDDNGLPEHMFMTMLQFSF